MGLEGRTEEIILDIVTVGLGMLTRWAMVAFNLDIV